jgi:hypothetical protein
MGEGEVGVVVVVVKTPPPTRMITPTAATASRIQRNV